MNYIDKKEKREMIYAVNKNKKLSNYVDKKGKKQTTYADKKKNKLRSYADKTKKLRWRLRNKISRLPLIENLSTFIPDDFP